MEAVEAVEAVEALEPANTAHSQQGGPMVSSSLGTIRHHTTHVGKQCRKNNDFVLNCCKTDEMYEM